MLRSMEDLEGYAIGATDGVVGHVKDLYFDDEAWVVRYFVVETGGWLSDRKVLISPFALDGPIGSEKVLPVSLTREKVKNSPDIDTDQAVSRQHEMEYLGYYGYPLYWGDEGSLGDGFYPGSLLSGWGGDRKISVPNGSSEAATAPAEKKPDAYAESHLRSCRIVIGYNVLARDGEIGHVQDMLVDDATWAIRYFVVNTSNWGFGRKVLIAPESIDDVRWLDATVSIDLTKEAIKDLPPFVPTEPLDL